jgi:hypothetical protein
VSRHPILQEAVSIDIEYCIATCCPVSGFLLDKGNGTNTEGGCHRKHGNLRKDPIWICLSISTKLSLLCIVWIQFFDNNTGAVAMKTGTEGKGKSLGKKMLTVIMIMMMMVVVVVVILHWDMYQGYTRI